jgi:hypothetical protein
MGRWRTLLQFAEFVKVRATHLRYAAGMNGSHGDGGASSLEHAVECFKAGLSERVPACWKEQWDEFNSSDYQKYVELHERFGVNERGKSSP